MAEVTLTVGNRQHNVACRDGSEEHLKRMAAMLDARWPDAVRAAGGFNPEKSMLLVGIMLADALHEAESRPAATGLDEQALLALAERLERLAATLENGAKRP